MAEMGSQIRDWGRPFPQSVSSLQWAIALTFESAIIAFGVGIATYFALPFEPSAGLIVGSLIAAIASMWMVSGAGANYATILVLAVCGFAWAALMTEVHDPNPLEREQRLEVSGLVISQDDGGRMRRLVIVPDSVDPVPDNGMPKSLRIRVGKAFDAVSVGDRIAVTMVVAPLPGPVVPNGYDPARRAYFDGLAGSGFAISGFEPLETGADWGARMRASLYGLRLSIAERIKASAPERTAGLQAALLTGIRDHIPQDQTDDLRASGLAHILAISGLHMGMVSLGVFSVASILLAAFERVSRARDVRKYAAVIALLAATAYLALSGASVATQRAYIMVSIAFCAVLLDRRAISLRSVAVAALVTLLIRPEALLSVGFQMSFAAVASMVVIFRAWQDYRPPRRAETIADRIRSFYGSLLGTSLIAGFATGGFALLHFGRIARYGLLGNMAAMVVFPLVMAFGIIALFAMPFGLEAAPLWFMSRLLVFMLSVADWVANLPGAVSTVKASQPVVIALYGSGFALACLKGWRARALGGMLAVTAFIIWMNAPTYDLRINPDGRVSVLSDARGVTSSLRADRYGRDQFSRADGQGDLEWSNYRDDFAQCDAVACRFEIKGQFVSVIEEPSEVMAACEDSALVILTNRTAGPVARRQCLSVLLDTDDLRKAGGVHVQIDDTVRLTPVLEPSRANRPWGAGQW